MGQYRDAYTRSIRDPEGFWAEAATGNEATAMTTAAPNSAERSIIGPLWAILH